MITRRTLHIIGLLAAIAVVAPISGATRPSFQFDRQQSPGYSPDLSFGGQQPPPGFGRPLVNLFIPLYGAFLDIMDDEEALRKPTFPEWCVFCGVTDPARLAALCSLYHWAQHTGFDPRPRKR